jgi:hypothetical protein
LVNVKGVVTCRTAKECEQAEARVRVIWERERRRVYFLNRWPSQRAMKRVRQLVK